MFALFLVLTLIFSKYECILCFTLSAYISQSGLHGEIHFIQKDSQVIELKTDLVPTLEYPEQIVTWSIHEFPVDYSKIENRCDEKHLGKKILDLENLLGYLTIPENSTASWDLPVKLTGDNGIWGRSILLKNVDNNMLSCATISSKDKTIERTAEARFHYPISGSIYFRWIAATKSNHVDMLIYTDLYHTRPTSGKYGRQFTEHNWKIYVTDIFDSKADNNEENCNALQLVYDPEDKGQGKGIGDVDQRVGKAHVAVDVTKISQKATFRDFELSALSSAIVGEQRKLYVVIFDDQHGDSFLSCSKIRLVDHIVTGAVLRNREIVMTQYWKYEPTLINFTSINSMLDFDLNYNIYDLPPHPKMIGTSEYCSTTGSLYDPLHKKSSKVSVRVMFIITTSFWQSLSVLDNIIPPPGYGTQEQYPIGDLYGKHSPRNGQTAVSSLSQLFWDTFLPLTGIHSIIHRSIIKNDQRKECATMLLKDNQGKQAQMFTAKIQFRYPIVGQMLFRQYKNQPWADTTILLEYLIHADGKNTNKSGDHRWAVHDNPPGRDFYNWTGRCLSTGDVYNPWNSITVEVPCNLEICRAGDLSGRHGMLTIAGSRIEAQNLTRRLYTDTMLPLQGPRNVLGKSLVIYDDIGTALRGDRLACAAFTPVYRRKAVARDWFPNGGPIRFKGKIEMTQQTEYDRTNVEVDLSNLDGINYNDYYIHESPVEVDLEFPCEPETLGYTYDPLQIKNKTIISEEQYAVGDLSGKIGHLDRKTDIHATFNDSLLPLFGYYAVIGRSVAIHGHGQQGLGTVQQHEVRRACATLERGYSPGEARELRAVASFHNPAGHAYGYVRFSQLAYGDGEQSDTIIEVNLRHPGAHDRNASRGHRWQIFVNPVGVDATVKTFATRCVAGGFTWNPFYTQLADPQNTELYDQECSPDNPLRCYAGDVSGRLGTLDLGTGRQVFTDPLFPLEGPANALGRSLVILGPKGSNDRFACANIEPEHDIVKYVNIRRPPKFVLAQFLQQVRRVMGLPPWMLSVDSRKTKILHNGGCVQLVVHFKGPIAGKLEQDFSRLVGSGRLDEPTLYVPGYTDSKRKKTISYSICSTTDGRNRNNKNISTLLKSNLFSVVGAIILLLV